jgi:hypothetical protein
MGSPSILAPRIRTMCLRRGRRSRSWTTLAYCSRFSTSTTEASAWSMMYCVSEGEQVV